MSLRNRIWINCHQAGPQHLPIADSLGVGGVRVDGVWRDLQSGPDQFTWGWLDELLATCARLDLQVYCSLSQTPPWLNPDPSALPPLYDWQRFCLAFAQHFKGRLTFVGCWNEYAGASKDYVDRLLRPMAEAFRGTDERYRICAPDIETERDWPERLTDILRMGGDCIDIVTVHAYEREVDALWSKLVVPKAKRPWWLPRIIPWVKPSIRQVIEAARWQGPTWLTETGWRSDQVGEQGQARRWSELLERLSDAPWPHGVCAFQLIDEAPPDRAPVTFGVFWPDGNPKMAAQTIRRYTARPQV